MKFGAMNFPIKPVPDELRKIADLGFDYFELSLDPPCAHYAEINRIRTELSRTLEDCGMELICHLPTFVYTADLAPRIRKASLEEMIFSLKTAARLHAVKAVVHPPMLSGLGPFVPEKAAGLARESLATVVTEAEGLGIPLCLENMFPGYHTFFSPEHFIHVFEAFPGLQLTLDTGHANMGDPEGTRLFEFIRMFPDRIGHIHVSDNNGKQDEHLRVGSGSIDFEKFAGQIKKSGYNHTMTLEIFSPDPKDLIQSRDRMAELFS
ncbi:sugar phosphate isomerase/epimerase family protein [Desulfospira joergensenii]|uniref:sugar phosphate isomerase/epimerase family protein n=1 Tax=Desulfospira joergensenii TaxID=53329 RepID=UPI0003B6DC13|nr:sugar phosphate isomerase/epimerase [Desulfospira joergensenii]